MKMINVQSEVKKSRGRVLLYTLGIVLFFVVFVKVVCSQVKSPKYPVNPINIIVPWPAGGASDVIARVMAPNLSKRLGVPVNVIDRPGGSGISGTLEAVKAPPDGYTLFIEIAGTSSAAYAFMEKELPFKVEERTFIARTTSIYNTITVRADAPWKTLDDFEKAVRQDPSNIKWGTMGGLSQSDIVMLQLKAALIKRGVDVSKTKTVSYISSSPIIALGGGHIDIYGGSYALVKPMLTAGKIRLIAITTNEGKIDFPEIKTTAEQGYPSVNLTLWLGFSGPPGLPENVVQTWTSVLKGALEEPEVIEKFKNVGAKPNFLPGDDFRKFVMAEGNSLRTAFKEVGLHK